MSEDDSLSELKLSPFDSPVLILSANSSVNKINSSSLVFILSLEISGKTELLKKGSKTGMAPPPRFFQNSQSHY